MVCPGSVLSLPHGWLVALVDLRCCSATLRLPVFIGPLHWPVFSYPTTIQSLPYGDHVPTPTPSRSVGQRALSKSHTLTRESVSQHWKEKPKVWFLLSTSTPTPAARERWPTGQTVPHLSHPNPNCRLMTTAQRGSTSLAPISVVREVEPKVIRIGKCSTNNSIPSLLCSL